MNVSCCHIWIDVSAAEEHSIFREHLICILLVLSFVRLSMIEVVAVEYVNGEAAHHEHEVQWNRTPPKHAFPIAHFQIPQHSDADEQSGHGTRQMRHIANLIVHIVYRSIHRQAEIRYAEYQKYEQLNNCVLHFAPILQKWINCRIAIWGSRCISVSK